MSELSDVLRKAESFSPTFKIMGDATRLKLLCAIHVAPQHSATVTQLADATGIRLATTSAALRSMEAARIVSSRREGRSVQYRIADTHVHELLHWFGAGHGDA